MPELTYRGAVAAGIAQEMERDSSVVFIGEDVGAAGGVFKTTEGLLDTFGPDRIRDTPISEQAIVGAVMGAAMTGLRPIGELMFSDFFAVAWDMVANQIAKTRYMTDGQVALPLVLRTANGGGLRFGAQHSQSVENWAMAIPGLKVVAPSNPADMKGLLAAAIRDPDPVIVLADMMTVRRRGVLDDEANAVRIGEAKVVREGTDVTLVAFFTLFQSLAVAEKLAQEGISVEVIDPRTLAPLDMATILRSVGKTGRLVAADIAYDTCSAASEVIASVTERAFSSLRAAPRRVCTPMVHVPFCPPHEKQLFPDEARIEEAVRAVLGNSKV
jgi:pyruvate/2-oxoglutarate/acetoin dehydrogenase E1 component